MHGTIAGSKIFLDNNETISFMKANESGTHTFLFDEILSPTQFKGYFSKGLDALKKQLENLRKKNDKAIITINAQQQLIVNQQPIDLIESNSTAVSTSDAISTVNKNKSKIKHVPRKVITAPVNTSNEDQAPIEDSYRKGYNTKRIR
jgi:hypothetical protein